MAEVSRALTDFPSYPVDIVLPSFNRADTAHAQFFFGIDWRTERGRRAKSFARKPFLAPCAVDIMPISA
jgi:hypothetical protein